MFCPKCGKPDQSPETYCRQCGVFLPDLNKQKAPTPPEQHLIVNAVLSSLSIVVSLAIAFILYSMNLALPETQRIVFIAASLLLAMSFWQGGALWRTILIGQHLKRGKAGPETLSTATTEPLGELPEGDFENMVPTSITDRTTKQLSKERPRSS